MNTPQKTSARKPQAETEIDMLKSTELLQQAMSLLNPLLEFHKADKEMTMDDVKIYWNVRAVRGKDTPFASLQGSCIMHQLLAPNMILDAPSRVEQEMVQKIVIPMVAITQSELQRVAFEELAAKEEAPAGDGLH